LARRLAREQARLAILARDEQELGRAKSDLLKDCPVVTTWQCDIKDELAVQSTISSVTTANYTFNAAEPILSYRLLIGLHFLPQLRGVIALRVNRQPFNLNRVFDHDLVFLFQALSTGCETYVRHSMNCCLRASAFPRWHFR